MVSAWSPHSTNTSCSEDKNIVKEVTLNLITTTSFVLKDIAIKTNLLLHRILNEQIHM